MKGYRRMGRVHRKPQYRYLRELNFSTLNEQRERFREQRRQGRAQRRMRDDAK